MAIIGQSRWDVDLKLFDSGTQDWPPDWTPDAYHFYAGQGFGFPQDINWANRPTGTEDHGGLVMGFPRSAEAAPPTPGAADFMPEYIKKRGC